MLEIGMMVLRKKKKSYTKKNIFYYQKSLQQMGRKNKTRIKSKGKTRTIVK